MADPNLSRQLASNVLEALKVAGHVLIAKGKTEALLRELGTEIEPTLARVIPRILRTEVTGEVTSTFGDEATDEAVEELVERLREQIIDSEGIEDVFAEDKVIERIIFRTLHEGLVHSAHIEGEDEEEPPPISVRLDTLGYVASTASKLSDSATLKDALERAALSASTELDTFDPGSRTAFFASSDDDPEKRLEIEEAIEEELADLVEMGLVDLPTAVRTMPLPRPVADDERKILRKPIHEIASRVLTSRVCPGTWDWDGAETIRLTFTPMSEPDAQTVDGLVASFTREVSALLLGQSDRSLPSEPTAESKASGKPDSSRAGLAALLKAVAAVSDAPPKSTRGAAVASAGKLLDKPSKAASAKGASLKAPPAKASSSAKAVSDQAKKSVAKKTAKEPAAEKAAANKTAKKPKD